MPNLGISFSPFSDQTETNPHAPSPTPQDAIRVLSLRYPRTVGAASPIPQQLLAGQGNGAASFAGVMPQAMNLDQLLAMLFGQQRPSTQPLPARGIAGPGQTMGGSFPGYQAPVEQPAEEPTPAPLPLPGFKVGQRPGDGNISGGAPSGTTTLSQSGPLPPFGAMERRRV